jgi:hypothetical protein
MKQRKQFAVTATAPATTAASFNIDTADNDSKAVFTGATTVTENGTSVLMVQLSGNPTVQEHSI